MNALTWGMVRELSRWLAVWRDDPKIAAVLVKAAPGRVFCAGGDIKAVTDVVRSGGVSAALPFFREEYRLNWRIHNFPKPYLALLDGVTLGGGVGISVHGAIRIVTENSLVAMPETAIGFFPDVGATWFLPRCPGEVGMYLGLTGARLNGADCLHAGIGTHPLPASRLEEFEAMLPDRLESGDSREAIAGALAELREDIGEASLPELRARIDRCFGADTLAEVLDRLAAEHAEQLELASLYAAAADRALHRDDPPEKRLRAAVGNLGVYAVCLGVVPDDKDRTAVAALMRATFPALLAQEIDEAVGLRARDAA